MFKDQYREVFSQVTASNETKRRILNMTKKQKPRRRIPVGKLIIAAAVVCMLAVTASAAEFIGGWYVEHFAKQNNEPLNDKQVNFLSDHVQSYQETQTADKWTVELQSAINDGFLGYVVLHVSAPEDVTLGNHLWLGPNSGILTIPEGVNASHSGYWEEDGDGRANTGNYVLEINPNQNTSTIEPFGPDVQWKIHIADIHTESFNEETGMIEVEEILCQGDWDFTFSFANGLEGVELIRTPVETRVEVVGDTEIGVAGALEAETVTITSFVLKPLSATVVCEPKRVTNYELDGKMTEVVMKDGTSIRLDPPAMNMGGEYNLLEAAAPIVLEDVDHILLPDGTVIPMP